MVIPLSYTVHCQNHTGGEAAMWLLMSPPRKDVSYGAVWVVVWNRYLISLYSGLTIFNALCVTALCTRLCTTNMAAAGGCSVLSSPAMTDKYWYHARLRYHATLNWHLDWLTWFYFIFKTEHTCFNVFTFHYVHAMIMHLSLSPGVKTCDQPCHMVIMKQSLRYIMSPSCERGSTLQQVSRDLTLLEHQWWGEEGSSGLVVLHFYLINVFLLQTVTKFYKRWS